eukprot:TRINITY_DN42636_c0_g1_i1.p1 TRINITY_DN42636_c0_g1~~TRINITY_DN42636_c0_g1_i1.p1  ORF type:complete len:395 (-),score=97.72 TRINITY_DN42636_c0_g1_i1:6-1151(-)
MADEVPRCDAEEVQLRFELFDSNRDGAIDRVEFCNMLASLKLPWSAEKMELVFSNFDADQDGQLTLTEFCAWLSQEATVLEQEASARITRRVFIKRKLAAGFDYRTACELYDFADQNQDGDIDSEELAKFLKQRMSSLDEVAELYRQTAESDQNFQKLVQAFLQWDENGDGTVELAEMTAVLKSLNPHFADEQIHTMMSQIDLDHNGFIDICEFVAWLRGQKVQDIHSEAVDKEAEEATIAMALHRARSQEARELGLQEQFETLQNGTLHKWYKPRKIKAESICQTLNGGLDLVCKECDGRHAWLCHYCGFVSFFEHCVNGCAAGSYGWTCISSECLKRKCGCKRHAEYWQRVGCLGDIGQLSKGVKTILEEAGVAVPSDK